jgi:RNA polymerase sigma factor (TIGR02999 family)
MLTIRVEEPTAKGTLLTTGKNEVTRLLDAWSAGDSAALDRLIPLVMDDLRRLARSYMARQNPVHTLEPTALVNEAYLRLVGRRTMPWQNRTQFFAYIATTMRRILVNHARDGKAAKKGGNATHVAFEEAFDLPAINVSVGWPGGGNPGTDLLDLDEALRDLSAVDPRQGRIVELRYFGGLTTEETAQTLNISTRTVKREWHTARLWLLRVLGEG